MISLGSGPLSKMVVTLHQPVTYSLAMGECSVAVNELIGKQIKLRYQGRITCCHCGRDTRKSFSQGYCYPCFKKLAACDRCIVSPETCHFAAGTCREPEWALEHCMVPHIVYLANASGLKVGITRESQIPTRWIDQGAVEAIPVFRVSNRLLSGLVEVVFKQYVADRTNWRAMLKGQAAELDLNEERTRLLGQVSDEIDQIRKKYPEELIERVDKQTVTTMQYPVEVWPQKVVSLNFDKTPEVEGRLMGVKGQYLILDSGCINIRKFGSYHVELLSE